MHLKTQYFIIKSRVVFCTIHHCHCFYQTNLVPTTLGNSVFCAIKSVVCERCVSYVCVCVKCTPTHRQVLHTVAVLHSTHRTHSVLAARRRRFGLQTLGRFNTLKHTQNTQNGQHSEHSHSEPASVRNIPEYRGFTLHLRTTWTGWEAVRVFDAHI